MGTLTHEIALQVLSLVMYLKAHLVTCFPRGRVSYGAALFVQCTRGPRQPARAFHVKLGSSSKTYKRTEVENATNQQVTCYLNNRQKCLREEPRGRRRGVAQFFWSEFTIHLQDVRAIVLGLV